MAITTEMEIRLLHEDIARLHKATKVKNKKKRSKAIQERDEYLNGRGYKVINVKDINGYHITYAIHEFLFDDSVMKGREKEEDNEEPNWAIIELGAYYFDEEKHNYEGLTVSLQGVPYDEITDEDLDKLKESAPYSEQLFVKEIREPNRMIPIGVILNGDMIELHGISGEVVKDYEDFSSEFSGEGLASKLSKFISSDEMVEELFYPEYYTVDKGGNYKELDKDRAFFFVGQ
jgi:hypothetical protein